MNRNIIIGLVVMIVLAGSVALFNRPQSGSENVQMAEDIQNTTGVLTDTDTVDIADIMNVNEEGVTTLDPVALDTILETSNSKLIANSDEQAGTIFMLEEEKLAHDVYRTLYEQWGMRVFDNISQSEATHIEAVRTLAEAYSIPIGFYNETVGVFHDEKLAGLYTELTERGSQSLDEALRVGALIEELDIVDLQRYINETDNQNFITVYENLQRGSRNHLRAFVRNISGEYTPVYLAQAEYDTVITTDTEREQGGQSGRSR